jgi:hypothetical protein
VYVFGLSQLLAHLCRLLPFQDRKAALARLLQETEAGASVAGVRRRRLVAAVTILHAYSVL